ncbi:DUF924 domain-containing protein [Rhodovulum sp. 12E13]|uniref:DUF924 family protein n=1 Tax=Rhodovulum sp. 12E13 TaxID=2203891 RepID=UPI000E199154|nr:DUF924 family protein [Rhodovulum sp. 12E13]RDC73463.1 DUF924 domain-containing protein [Rhodovulum sp. 12E13]
MGVATPAEVVSFWVEEVGPAGWYRVDETVDMAIRDRFAETWTAARAGGLSAWLCGPQASLAYLIVTDQFPRNMFRGDDGRAYATDRLARRAALRALGQRWDMRVAEPQRQFFYLPLMHSEVLADQEHALRLILTRMPRTGADNLLHARAHREVIRRHGRFPHRNAALGRRTTAAEQVFLEGGGYAAVVRDLQAEAA